LGIFFTKNQARKKILSAPLYFNHKYQRCGALFQDRFRSELVETEAYFLTVLRYIHQNPVKTALVNSPQDYTWSSYRDYQHQTGITNTGLAGRLLGNDFENFMQATNTDDCLDTESNYGITDLELCALIKEQLGIAAVQISGLKPHTHNALLRKAKTIPGITEIQLVRVTGVQVYTIWRLGKAVNVPNISRQELLPSVDKGG
jgi:hypothetical protein